MNSSIHRRLPALLAALLVVLSLVAGCGSDGSAGKAEPKQQTLRVFAAASLTESFTALGKQFESEHDGVKVVFNFGPSSGLAQQIQSGAPADVFASASPTNMDTLVQSKDADKPRDFAVNTMEIAVPPANPGKVQSLSDLARAGVKVAVCQPQVPCGVVAAKVFEQAGVKVKPVTEEVDVKSVLTKVSLGEVDAGVVYVTDVKAAGDKVTGITIPAAQNAETTYPIATLANSKNSSLAKKFMDLVLSKAGTTELAKAGFGAP